MLNRKDGVTFIEAMLAAATLVIIAILIMPQLTKKREALTTLSSFSSCNELSTYFLTNISTHKNSIPIRNFLPGTRPGANYWAQDPYCTDAVPGRLACDHLDHVEPGLILNNFQNIRSAVTWAGVRFDTLQYRPANSCTARFVFERANNSLSALQNFLPARIADSDFNALLINQTNNQRVERVRFDITQLNHNQRMTNCGSRHLVRPNTGYSFDIEVTVEYNNPARGPSSISSCRNRMNFAYEWDRSPAFTRASLPRNHAGSSFSINNSCNPGNPPGNDPNRQIIYLGFQVGEPGTIALCRTTSVSPPGSAPVVADWHVCGPESLLAGKAPSLTTSMQPQSTAYQDPTQPAGPSVLTSTNNSWSFELRYGVPVLPPAVPTDVLPYGSYTVQMRAVDTAGNCHPSYSTTCPTEQLVSFDILPNCTPAYLGNFCPDERPPDGCGANCAQYGTKDPRCPDPSTYFSCNKRCGTICRNTICTPEPGNPYTGAQLGTRDWVQTPGDNMCPPANTYCASVQPQKPCGLGACPVGTKDGCDGKCAGEQDECSGTNSCTGLWGNGSARPGCGPTGARISGSEPVGTNGCNGNYVPFCPPTDQYCSNEIVRDQCGNPCPIGTMQDNSSDQNYCCDRCPSDMMQFESMAECMDPSRYSSGPLPVTCSQITYGSSTRCFVPVFP